MIDIKNHYREGGGQMEKNDMAYIKPFEYKDSLTGRSIAIRTTPQYSILSIDDRKYYFIKETGQFDGTSFNHNSVEKGS